MKIKALTVGLLQTNCYILADEKSGECAVIDPGGDADRILPATEGYKVKYIILTHGHFDHYTAAEEVREKTGGKVLINKKDLYLLYTDIEESSVFRRYNKPPEIDGYIEEGEDLTVGSLTLKILNTPGHTKGSCVILCNNVMFSGDTLFLESWGRCDLEGGDDEEMRKSCLRLAELPDDYVVLPGHGESTRLSYEKEYNPIMRRI